MDNFLNNDFVKIAIILVAIFLVFKLFSSKESLDNVDQTTMSPSTTTMPPSTMPPNDLQNIISGSQPLTTNDLLPKYDEASDFVKQNPVSDLLKGTNQLISGFHVGINTVSSSHKIPSYSLRSNPPIPKNDNLTPWNNSTLSEPIGSGRRPLEIGMI